MTPGIPRNEAQRSSSSPQARRLGEPALADLSILKFVNVLLRFRGTFVLSAIIAAAIVMAIALTESRTYTSITSFMPERGGNGANAGIAAQLGLSVSGNQSAESPAFYLELLKTHDMLNAIAGAEYPLGNGAATGPLERAYGISGPSPSLARESAIRRLAVQTHSTASAKTGIVNIAVTTPSRALSTQIAQQVLIQLRRFNAERRQTQATSEREFAEARMVEGKQELTQAEGRLEGFLQVNRDYRNAPRLVFEEDRLARDVGMRQQLYTSLTQAYEQAKLEEVRQTATLTVLQPPFLPVSADPRGLIRRALFALLFGLMVGVLFAYIRQYAEKARTNEVDEYSEFKALKRDAIADFRHPLRTIIRARRS
jgi:uncharacterized protein involved in exopolysaccharide biosynthesis